MPKFTPTIGLEIHAELNTQSKMFCGCKNDPDAVSVNVHVCPVCMAHPGALPVPNEEAIFQVLRVGVAVGGTLATFTEFDRKNYFYPDIPKGYQISQYKHPMVSGGAIGPVEITRIHLEEDTARSTHTDAGSLVDFNRSGVPLMELVTEPCIHDADTAVAFARDLMLTLRYLGASHANLEKGEMRVEANISVAPEGSMQLGTKVEVKNLNSFRAVRSAIVYEIHRQVELIGSGGLVAQETRGWDEARQRTFSQRKKESSHDYRYFPDPDIPKYRLEEISRYSLLSIQGTLPVLPWQRRESYRTMGLSDQTVELLVSNIPLQDFYESVCTHLSTEKEQRLALNYITSDLWGMISATEYDGTPLDALDAEEFAGLIQILLNGDISSRGAKIILEHWTHFGGTPSVLADKLSLRQISDSGQLTAMVEQVLSVHADAVEEYRAGKEQALQFLVGQGMRISKGAANPSALRDAISAAITKKGS